MNLIPESVYPIRVIEIEGLDKQADRGTHVRSTAEVGRVRVAKTENKGQGVQAHADRARLSVSDAHARNDLLGGLSAACRVKKLGRVP